MDVVLPVALTLGFLSGFKHAIEPDHVIAISTLLHREPRLTRALGTGVAWGAGHTTMLMATVAVLGTLRVELSPQAFPYMELPVAAMLLLLGGWALVHSSRGLRRLHRHRQDADPDFHDTARPHPHGVSGKHRSPWRGYCVGLVHGLAGSAAVLLLVATTLPSLGLSLVYALVFGLGSILGMVGVTAAIAYPFLASRSRPTSYNLLTGASGMLSVGLGAWIVYGVL